MSKSHRGIRCVYSGWLQDDEPVVHQKKPAMEVSDQRKDHTTIKKLSVENAACLHCVCEPHPALSPRHTLCGKNCETQAFPPPSYP